MKRIRVGNAVVCEFIVQGSTGKHTLVNVFGGDILVKELPARISLAFYIEIVPDAGMPKDLKLDLILGTKTLATADAEFQYEPGKIGVIVLPQAQITVEEETRIRVVASGTGRARTALVDKSICKGDIPGLS
jgi:hypothetical protein